MRIHVVSDVHGAAEDLAAAAEGADHFVCLGDLILFLDYEDPTRGIHSELFGAEHTRAYIAARTAGRFEDARELSAAAWARRGVLDPADRWQTLEGMIEQQYEQMFAQMPEPALLTYGNVDVPRLWEGFLRPGHRVLDAVAVDIDGVRMGFVGGGLVSPMRTPYEIDPADYADKLAHLGPVDVLFVHIPPAVPELCYDVVARRFEVGSAASLEYIREHQPAHVLFGHVHQPLRARGRIGRSELHNVGHFNGTRRPYVLDL